MALKLSAISSGKWVNFLNRNRFPKRSPKSVGCSIRCVPILGLSTTAPRTEEAYVHWIKRYIYFTGKRHPRELGAAEVGAFLSHLATERNVAAAMQNQTLSALLFLYAQVLGTRLP